MEISTSYSDRHEAPQNASQILAVADSRWQGPSAIAVLTDHHNACQAVELGRCKGALSLLQCPQLACCLPGGLFREDGQTEAVT